MGRIVINRKRKGILCVCVSGGADGLSKGVELGTWRKMRRAFSWSREFRQERMEIRTET